MSLSSKIWTAIVPLPERSIPWSGRWCWDTCHLGVSLLMERYSFAGGKSSSKEARNRRRSVPRGGLGFVSFPWQPCQCLIKLSPCPPPSHAPPSPPSCRSNCRPPSLSFTLVSTKQPRKDPAKEDSYKAVGHFLFVSNNLWDLHTPMLVTFTHYDSSRVATEHLIHYSNG